MLSINKIILGRRPKGALNELIKAANERKREEKLRKLRENKNIPVDGQGGIENFYSSDICLHLKDLYTILEDQNNH